MAFAAENGADGRAVWAGDESPRTQECLGVRTLRTVPAEKGWRDLWDQPPPVPGEETA